MNLSKKHQIITKYLDGLSQREIAKELNISRTTVSNYINEYDSCKKDLIEYNSSNDKNEIIERMLDKPKYNTSNRKKIKLTNEIIDRIQFYLDENEIKKKLGQRKQQKKNIDIFEQLKEENIDIGYATVCNTIKEIINKKKEAFVKAEYQLGDVCEFDWGEVNIFIDSVLTKFQIAIFTSAKGNYRFAYLFRKQDTLAFNEAHMLFFKKINAVYRTIVYDNTKVVIKKFVGKKEKEPTEALMKISSYYGFKFRFCNIYAGNEKGHVEKSVDYIRRKSFGFVDSFKTIDEANEYLQEKCEKINNESKKYYDNQCANQILAEEIPYMLSAMPPFEIAIIENLRVDKYSTILVDTAHYSVPDYYVGKVVLTKKYSHQIICYFNNEKISVHPRTYEKYGWIIDIEHYICTLKRKPNALLSSTAFKQMPIRLKKIYQDYYIKKEKEFIDLIQLIKEYGYEKITKIIDGLELISPLDVSNSKINSLLGLSENNANNNISIQDFNSIRIKEMSLQMLSSFKDLISTPFDLQNISKKEGDN